MANRDNKNLFASYVDEASAKHGIPPELLMAQIQQESGFNPNAVSPVGAQGIMQIMPGTAKDLGLRNPLDPKESIDKGAKYLKNQYNKFGSWDLALAAYNAGPGNVQKHGGIPPFKETQNYVKNIMGKSGIGAPMDFRKMDDKSLLEYINQSPEVGAPKTGLGKAAGKNEYEGMSDKEVMALALGKSPSPQREQTGMEALGLEEKAPREATWGEIGRAGLSGAARALPGSDIASGLVGAEIERNKRMLQGNPMTPEEYANLVQSKTARFKETAEAAEAKAPGTVFAASLPTEAALFATGEGAIAKALPFLAPAVEGGKILNTGKAIARSALTNVPLAQAKKGLDTSLSERWSDVPEQLATGAVAQAIPEAIGIGGKGLKQTGAKFLESSLGKKAAGTGEYAIEQLGLSRSAGKLGEKNVVKMTKDSEALNSLLGKHADKRISLPQNTTVGDIEKLAEKNMMSEDWDMASKLQEAANMIKKEGGMSPEAATTLKRAYGDEAYSLASGEGKNTKLAAAYRKKYGELRSNIEKSVGPEGKAVNKLNEDLSKGIRLNKAIDKSGGKQPLNIMEIIAGLAGMGAFQGAGRNMLEGLLPLGAYKALQSVPGGGLLGSIGKTLEKTGGRVMPLAPAAPMAKEFLKKYQPPQKENL